MRRPWPALGCSVLGGGGNFTVIKIITLVRDFKFSPCSECHILSFGWFPGAWILCADVSEHSVWEGQGGTPSHSYRSYLQGSNIPSWIHGLLDPLLLRLLDSLLLGLLDSNLRPRGHCDRQFHYTGFKIRRATFLSSLEIHPLRHGCRYDQQVHTARRRCVSGGWRDSVVLQTEISEHETVNSLTLIANIRNLRCLICHKNKIFPSKLFSLL